MRIDVAADRADPADLLLAGCIAISRLCSWLRLDVRKIVAVAYRRCLREDFGIRDFRDEQHMTAEVNRFRDMRGEVSIGTGRDVGDVVCRELVLELREGILRELVDILAALIAEMLEGFELRIL